MRVIAVAIVFVVLSACASQQPTPEAKLEAAQSVGILFSVDGITVYRFGDGGRYHYFAVKDGREDTVTLTNWTKTKSCGKNCTRTEHHEEQIDAIVARWRVANNR